MGPERQTDRLAPDPFGKGDADTYSYRKGIAIHDVHAQASGSSIQSQVLSTLHQQRCDTGSYRRRYGLPDIRLLNMIGRIARCASTWQFR